MRFPTTVIAAIVLVALGSAVLGIALITRPTKAVLLVSAVAGGLLALVFGREIGIGVEVAVAGVVALVLAATSALGYVLLPREDLPDSN